MLLLLIVESAPVVALLSYSIGIFTFLKNVSSMRFCAQSLVVPLLPPALTFSVYVRSIRVLNRLLFDRLLKLWKDAVSSIPRIVAAEPFVCLSR